MEIGRETASVQSADEYGAITKRVGAVLIGVGLLDIGVIIYCLANGQSYSSSLNIFAVIAGLFLRKGSIGAVRIVGWFSVFLFTGLVIGFVALAPWITPLDYQLTFVRQHPLVVAVLGFVFVVGVIAYCFGPTSNSDCQPFWRSASKQDIQLDHRDRRLLSQRVSRCSSQRSSN